MIESSFLNNHFLIAMPALADPNFSRTVTYVCQHNSSGAMGIVINRPLTISLGEILQHLRLKARTPQIALQPIYLGGPLHRERVFVIHQPLWRGDLTLPVSDAIGMTVSRDIFSALAHGEFTGHSLVALGYAGWGEGQLEQELGANSWLTGQAHEHVLFDSPPERRWAEAAALLGVDISQLWGEAGHG